MNVIKSSIIGGYPLKKISNFFTLMKIHTIRMDNYAKIMVGFFILNSALYIAIYME